MFSKPATTVLLALAAVASARDIMLLGGIPESVALDALSIFDSLNLGDVIDGGELAGIGYMNQTELEMAFPEDGFLVARNTDKCYDYTAQPTTSFFQTFGRQICRTGALVGGEALGGGIAVLVKNAVCRNNRACAIAVYIGGLHGGSFTEGAIENNCVAGLNNIVKYCSSHTGMDHADDVNGFATQVRTSLDAGVSCKSITPSMSATCTTFTA